MRSRARGGGGTCRPQEEFIATCIHPRHPPDRRYVEMEADTISKDNKLDMDVASVRTWSGRELPIEFHGEMKIRSMQQVQDQEKVTVRDEVRTWLVLLVHVCWRAASVFSLHPTLPFPLPPPHLSRHSALYAPPNKTQRNR